MAFENKLLTVLIFAVCFSLKAHAEKEPPLVVGTVIQRPYLFPEEVEDNRKQETIYKGFIKDIMDEIAKFAHLEYRFQVRPDSRFGDLLENNTWGGLIGNLHRQEVDIVAAPLTETSVRQRFVSFSTWFQQSGPVVVMKKKDRSKLYSKITLTMRLNRLFEPLTDSVWLLSIVAWLVTSITLYFISYVNPYDWRRMCRDREATMREGESFTCLNSFWFTLSAIFWQGYLRCPRSIGARIVVLSWWIYSLIFVSMYIASLTNYLHASPMDSFIDDDYNEITSIEDLGFQTRVKYGVLGNGATLALFRNSQRTEYARIWAEIKQTKSFVSSIDAGIKKVRVAKDRPFALIMESAMAKHYINQKPCDLYMIKDYSTSGSYSFAYQFDNTTLGAIIDSVLLSLRESGRLQQMEDFWFPEDSTCPQMPRPKKRNNSNVPKFYKVDLASFSGALILIVIGIVTGAIVTCLEICIYKFAETGDRDRERNAAKTPLNDQSVKETATHSSDPEPMTDV